MELEDAGGDGALSRDDLNGRQRDDLSDGSDPDTAYGKYTHDYSDDSEHEDDSYFRGVRRKEHRSAGQDAYEDAYELTMQTERLLFEKKTKLWEAQQMNVATKRQGGGRDNERQTKRCRLEVADAEHAVAEAKQAELETLRAAVARKRPAVGDGVDVHEAVARKRPAVGESLHV